MCKKCREIEKIIDEYYDEVLDIECMWEPNPRLVLSEIKNILKEEK